VQADHSHCGLVDGPERGGEAMAQPEAGATFSDADRPHPLGVRHETRAPSRRKPPEGLRTRGTSSPRARGSAEPGRQAIHIGTGQATRRTRRRLRWTRMPCLEHSRLEDDTTHRREPRPFCYPPTPAATTSGVTTPSAIAPSSHVDDFGPAVAALVAVAHQAWADRVAVGPVVDQDTAQMLAGHRVEGLEVYTDLTICVHAGGGIWFIWRKSWFVNWRCARCSRAWP